jgi:hypothetical protein
MKYKDYTQDTNEKRTKKAQEPAKTIQRLTNINPFAKSRQQQVIEIRSLFNVILFKYLNFTLCKIRDIHQDNGLKTYHHATVLHSLNNFPMYRKYNKQLDIFLMKLISDDDEAHRLNGTKREIKHDTKKKSFKVEIIDNSSSQ